jgi:anti-sigma regulatory factor (Ser/Thr protein kinase)
MSPEAACMCRTTARVEVVLPLSTAAPAAARAFARASGCADHPAQLDEALLLITELVTNSVRYSSPTLMLSIECLGSNLKVRVRDGSTALPQQRRARDDDEAGRGLALVEALSDAWGVERVSDEDGSGKAVWFELRPPA